LSLSDYSVTDLLGPGGPIAAYLRGFAPRDEQLHLAQAVDSALEQHSTLIGEAGTGTGKTFAYLVPAIMSGQRIIISTGTRHLQDQLFHTDMPLVHRALAAGARLALLKGRANYLCRHRLVRAMQHPMLREAKYQEHLLRLQEWSRATKTGDIAEVLNVPEDSAVWGLVTSTDEFCSQHEFEELDDCFIHQARKRAQEAELVVVNHHLLCADLALKEEGFGELLPSANAFILDEAHQIPEIAANFFGRRLSSKQLLDLARDTVGEQLHEAPDVSELRDAAAELENSVRYFRLAFGVDPQRDAWHKIANESAIERELSNLHGALDGLHRLLDLCVTRGKGLDSCLRRCTLHRQTLSDFTATDSGQYIHWFETYRTGFGLNMTPLDVAKPFQRAMQAMPAAWVFTSATLAVGGDFSHFKSSLGIVDSEELLVDSPFDYRANALLYLPEGLPEPNAPSYTIQSMQAALPVLQACGGRAFLLFTSYRAMHEAFEFFKDKLTFPILVQGQMPKRELIEAFQSIGNAVLLGTSSFWEGVDVRGEALSCVIIDKLPFGSPGDPVMSARISSMRESGGNPFYEYQLPQAAIALKQGVGRLIRDVTDRGVLMLCDPRIQSRQYGEVFINSLPPMPITRELEEVEEFFINDNESLSCEPVGD